VPFHLQVKSLFGARMFALGVVVKVPVPKHTAKATIIPSAGKAKYDSKLDCLVWK
jgi:AP-2 complex subunit mu-1